MIFTSCLYVLAGVGMSVVRAKKKHFLIGLMLALTNAFLFISIGQL